VPAMERGLPPVALEEAAAANDGGLRARADELAGLYEELASEAETAAVRWRWATPTSGHGDIEPLRLERMGCSPGRWLHRPPPPWREHEAIGFDALGRVVCVRQYDSTGEVWLERFASWGRDQVEVACFRAPLECGDGELPAELQSVMRMRLAAGKPVESERHMPPTGSCTRERYRHEGGRLARVEEDSCDDGGGLATVVKEVVYGDDGRVLGVDALGPDGRQVVWRSGGQPHPARREARTSVSARLRRQVCV
jgi:hypothetical protein